MDDPGDLVPLGSHVVLSDHRQPLKLAIYIVTSEGLHRLGMAPCDAVAGKLYEPAPAREVDHG